MEANEGDDRRQFEDLMRNTNYHLHQACFRRALSTATEALLYTSTPEDGDRARKMIQSLQAHIRSHGVSNEDEFDLQDLGNAFYLARNLIPRLYEYQKEGILWLWKLYRMNEGGILADDMGLGKTIQIIAFLSGLFDSNLVQRILIVVPMSLLVTWQREFHLWAPGIPIATFHGRCMQQRMQNYETIVQNKGVLLTTYGAVMLHFLPLSGSYAEDRVWDYCILDEGHNIKCNRAKTTKAVNAVPSKHRLVLTGTAVQNCLQELWVLFDFTHRGALLGTLKTFKQNFEGPITRARQKDATNEEKHFGTEMAGILKDIIAPFFLRRTKQDLGLRRLNDQMDGGVPWTLSSVRKTDLIVWVHLSPNQLKLYTDFIAQARSIQDDYSTSILVELLVLKKICDHPRLLPLDGYSLPEHSDGPDVDVDKLEEQIEEDNLSTILNSLNPSELVAESGKLEFVVKLLDNLCQEGHRVLLFSQSTKILDILQCVLQHQGHCFVRVDGTVRGSDRQNRIDAFQSDPKYNVFLLTTRVGGVGLTLTAADRVIIYDPCWNPSVDAQAVDRAYRIGQTKDVIIYRLMTTSTIEEKIYRRQIFKESLICQMTGKTKNPFRYFSKQDLMELFKLGDPYHSETQVQLECLHPLRSRRFENLDLDRHIEFLKTLDIVGINDHGMVFNGTETNDVYENAWEKAQVEMKVHTAAKNLNCEIQEMHVTPSPDRFSDKNVTANKNVPTVGFIKRQKPWKERSSNSAMAALSPAIVDRVPNAPLTIEASGSLASDETTGMESTTTLFSLQDKVNQRQVITHKDVKDALAACEGIGTYRYKGPDHKPVKRKVLWELFDLGLIDMGPFPHTTARNETVLQIRRKKKRNSKKKAIPAEGNKNRLK